MIYQLKMQINVIKSPTSLLSYVCHKISFICFVVIVWEMEEKKDESVGLDMDQQQG